MDKKKLIILILIIATISFIVLLISFWTTTSIVSGGFYDPKAIILLPNETRNVEISLSSIISQDVLVSLSINDDRIGISISDCLCKEINMVGNSLSSFKKQTNTGKVIIKLKILDNSIPSGEYSLNILIDSFPYQRIEIPVYVGYHIKDE